MGDAFIETYSPRAPELTYIVVIGDDSELDIEASDESTGFRIRRVADTWLSRRTTHEPRFVASVD